MRLHVYEGIVLFSSPSLPDQLTAMKKRASEGSRGDQIIMWCILLIQEKGGGLNETLASPASSDFYFFVRNNFCGLKRPTTVAYFHRSSLWFLCAAVKGIKKQHLVEVRSLPQPPRLVKLAMESICLLIGEPTTDWRSIRSILIRENFIPTIINFSTEDIT